MHRSPEIAAPFLVEDFCGVGQPIEILAGEAELHLPTEQTALNRDHALNAKFSFLFNFDVPEVDLRVAPGKGEGTGIQLQMLERFIPRELGQLFEKPEIIDTRVTQT